MRDRIAVSLLLFPVIAFLVSCLALVTDPAPSDGRATLTSGNVQVSIMLPESARGRRMPPPSPKSMVFRNELGDDHTVSALVLIGEKARADKTDQEMLELVVEQFERELSKAPGRQGAVLRSIERAGGTRPRAPTEGVHCVEYVWVSEDRLVPGHKGEPFIMHAHDYFCIHPGTRVWVETHFSERYSAERSQLRPTFDEDVAFFFDSLRFN